MRAQPAPRGKKPTWGGFAPQFLGHEMCQRIRTILVSADEYCYLRPTAADALAHQRADLCALLRDTDTARFAGDRALTWWTFAGGRINTTLKHALTHLTDWKVISDNFAVQVKGEGVGHAAFEEARARLRDEAFWRDEEAWSTIQAGLPAYRLSKFQPALPAWAQGEMLGRFLLDRVGATDCVI